MRKFLVALSAIVATAMATPAVAQPVAYRYAGPAHEQYALPLAGAAVGTAVGVGTYNGWWGSSAAASALPSTAAGAAATGFVAGVGTVALLDAAIQPCRGFHAILSPFFGGSHGECVDGAYVGYRRYGPPRYRR